MNMVNDIDIFSRVIDLKVAEHVGFEIIPRNN